jgi:hypothetical protein
LEEVEFLIYSILGGRPQREQVAKENDKQERATEENKMKGKKKRV